MCTSHGNNRSTDYTALRSTSSHIAKRLTTLVTGFRHLTSDLSHFCVLELSVASHRALVSNSSLVRKGPTRADNIPTCLPLDRHHHVCPCTAANPTKKQIPTPTFCVFSLPNPLSRQCRVHNKLSMLDKL